MNLTEFNDRFDIRYDSIAGKSAPNIDLYEKSVYLTLAQQEIVKNRYNPNSNIKQKGFEGSEKRRVDLKELIRDYKTNQFFVNNNVINDNSKFVTIPEDSFLIISEKAKGKYKGCSSILEVLPKTHDEYIVEIRNPFKNPNYRRIWRMDFSKQNAQKTLELITHPDLELEEYQMRYIKHPKPIILVDLNEEYPNESLSIDGYTEMSECELDSSIHSEILNRAVELAMGDYKPDEYQLRTHINIKEE